HFYRTWWFGALALLGVAGAIASGERIRERRARARETTLMRLVEQRTRELEQANQRLERLSHVDGLTGLANRRRFDESFDVEWRRGSRSSWPLWLMLIDVDAFKAFNDTYGHLEGGARPPGGGPLPAARGRHAVVVPGPRRRRRGALRRRGVRGALAARERRRGGAP